MAQLKAGTTVGGEQVVTVVDLADKQDVIIPPTITGSKASGAAFQSLLDGLAAAGLIIDSTSA